MRLILQRVTRAAVEVAGERVGAIGRGLLVFVAVQPGDGAAEVAQAAAKLLGLRIFDDGAGRMNLDLGAAGGSLLLVSQFTLVADLRHGRRPSFTAAAAPAAAEPVLAQLADTLRAAGARVETGCFGARMRVESVNDGPATFLLDLPPAEPPGAVES